MTLDIKYIIKYPRGTIDFILFYAYNSYGSKWLDHVDLWYLSDYYKVWSQSRSIFVSGNAVISWGYNIQILVVVFPTTLKF